jgi:hypothetical protein
MIIHDSRCPMSSRGRYSAALSYGSKCSDREGVLWCSSHIRIGNLARTPDSFCPSGLCYSARPGRREVRRKAKGREENRRDQHLAVGRPGERHHPTEDLCLRVRLIVHNPRGIGSEKTAVAKVAAANASRSDAIAISSQKRRCFIPQQARPTRQSSPQSTMTSRRR